MTLTVYPQERKVLSVEGGYAQVRQGSIEYVRIITVKDEKTGDEVEVGRQIYGGLGAATLTLPVRQVMTRKEHRQITSFLKFRQRYDREVIPVLKQEIRQKMMTKFGTMDLETFKSRILVEMQADPRLYLKTRKNQTIKTTVSENAQYQSERNAAWMERIRK